MNMFLEKILNVPSKISQDVESLKKSELPLIVYGVGSLAKAVLKMLSQNKIRIDHVVAARDYYVPNSCLGNYPIEQKTNILNRYPKMNVIIAFGNRYREEMEELTNNSSVESCFFFDPAVLRFDFGDYYSTVQKHEFELNNLYEILADDLSRKLMIAFINARISGNSEALNSLNIEREKEYFPEFINFSEDEVFVDCGAYDGDTMLSFIDVTHGKYSKIFAFEPEKCNIEKMRKNISQFENIEIIEKGCFSNSQILYFQGEGGTTSSVSDQGNIKIEVAALDNIISEKVTFIKMDINGSELEALKGAQNIIRSHRPRLAICLYHRYDDLFLIPQYIYELNNTYKFYLRHYGLFCSDLILYAI